MVAVVGLTPKKLCYGYQQLRLTSSSNFGNTWRKSGQNL